MMLTFDRVQAITPLHLVLEFGLDLLSHSRDRTLTNIKKKDAETTPSEKHR